MLSKTTYVNVGRSGTFNPSANHRYDTKPEDVDAIIELLRTNNQRELGLYFHGGLVKDTAGIQSAKIMNSKITESGLHPISFVWETGIFDVLREKLDKIGRKTLFKIIQRIIVRRLGDRIPLSKNREAIKEITYSEIEFELSKKTPFKNYVINDNYRVLEDNNFQTEDEMVITLEEDIKKDVLENPILIEGLDIGEVDDIIYDNKYTLEKSMSRDAPFLGGFFWSIAKIVYNIILRFKRDNDHGFYATMIEEIFRRYYVAKIGASIWQEMKDKAKEMWKSNTGRSGNNLYAGTYLLTKLNELGTIENPIIINLIGHSAGSIAICYLIKEVQENYPHIKVNNLVFLAPACRSELFDEYVVQKTERFNEIRIFTMSDEYERKDTLIDGFSIVYPHSLLYFISGILEDAGKNPDAHILGLERHVNWQKYMKHSHLKNINTYLNDTQKNRLVLSVSKTNEVGLSSNAIDHGDFDDNPNTLTSIVHILKNGLN
ncbi:hypothetical protein DUT90_01985 [Polaribacter sp. WD7]|uniref:hypothetical protein n=1 Tax=Polaribacter sp. WD7 TaxID=2269061 RepID=UPI000DF23632|nr:hypothetical protein [Polaribacter sp. WD7]RCS28101.1 hypothetical protein DUT90_01985 [Polaribacter sp. WD7]